MLEGRHFELRGARELRRDDLPAVVLERFASRLRADPSGCVLWIGSANSDGYGTLRVGDRVVLAHRVAIAVADGICPGDFVAGHGATCVSRRCCRREHLELTTPELNTPGIYGLVDPADQARDAAELRAYGIPPRPRDDDLRADEIPF